MLTLLTRQSSVVLNTDTREETDAVDALHSVAARRRVAFVDIWRNKATEHVLLCLIDQFTDFWPALLVQYYYV